MAAPRGRASGRPAGCRRQRAVERLDAAAQAGQAGAARGRRRRGRRRRPRRRACPAGGRRRIAPRVGAGVLGRVGQRLGDDEVGGGLDRAAAGAVRRRPSIVTGTARRRRERLERRLQAAVGEHRRSDAAREVAQLARSRAAPRSRASSSSSRGLGVAVELAPRPGRGSSPARRAAPARRRAGRARCGAARPPRRRRRRRGCA